MKIPAYAILIGCSNKWVSTDPRFFPTRRDAKKYWLEQRGDVFKKDPTTGKDLPEIAPYNGYMFPTKIVKVYILIRDKDLKP